MSSILFNFFCFFFFFYVGKSLPSISIEISFIKSDVSLELIDYVCSRSLVKNIFVTHWPNFSPFHFPFFHMVPFPNLFSSLAAKICRAFHFSTFSSVSPVELFFALVALCHMWYLPAQTSFIGFACLCLSSGYLAKVFLQFDGFKNLA